ncbi:Piwi-domain-containing protein [Aureobasidium subglaciale]|nr:Piwi-domain-containing protein [Aureobasidium subglaciale]
MDLVSEYVGGAQTPRPQDVARAEAFIRMLRVRTNYLKALDTNGKPQMDAQGKPQTVAQIKSIVGLAPRPRNGSAKTVSFSWTDHKNPQAAARSVTVFDYFKTEHGITLRHPDLPVLNVGTRGDPSYLPIELATVIPGQPVRRLLSGAQTTHMINFAARAPRLNAESIAGTPGNGLKTMGFNGPAQVMNKFGFEVSKELITVCYGNKELQAREGSWNLIGTKFSKPGSIGSWACVVLNYDDHRGAALLPRGSQMQGMDVLDDNGLLAALERHLTAYGVRMGPRLQTQHKTIPRPNEQSRHIIDAKLDEIFLKASSHKIELLFIILKEADKWLYSRIKYYGDVKHGLFSINTVGSKLQKPKGQDMYLGNLALKFNIKGGGVVHTQRDMYPLDGKNTCMLVGIDVTHPSPGSAEGSPSIAGVVASVDEHLSAFPGSLRSQRGKEEMVQGLTDMMLERLELWRKHNKNLPSKIVIFRDGVSEGQYDLVLDLELPPIQKAFEKLYGDSKKWPKVTIVIVGKRHHTRFYPTDNKSMDQRTGNPMPGTVVDRGVTSHILYDFFLQAHKGLQGTARPAHYVVIKDELNFGADALQTWVHKLCYMFNRATKAVSICPPAYYADLICERGRMYLYSTLNENQSANGSAYNAQTAEWTQGVHPKLSEKTFYI